MTSSTLTLNVNAAKPATKTITVAQIVRTVARKWDMAAVIALMASSAAYAVFALGHVA